VSFTWFSPSGPLHTTHDWMSTFIKAATANRMPDVRGAAICAAMCAFQEAGADLDGERQIWIPGNNADPCFAANPNSFPHDAMGDDHLSTGPFQQQMGDTWGWGGAIGDCNGTAARMDPYRSTVLFMTFPGSGLKDKGYDASNAASAGAAIQAVQGSADPDAYSQWWGRAVGLYNDVSAAATPSVMLMSASTALIPRTAVTVTAANVQAVNDAFDARQRAGAPYVYGGDYAQNNSWQGADCSYVVSWVIRGYLYGLNGFNWFDHPVSTEAWPYTYSDSAPNGGIPAAPGTVGPYGTIAIASPDDQPADSALLICIMHQGGGENSHMNCLTGPAITPTPLPTPAGKIMESNGGPGDLTPSGTGTCTNGTGGTPANSPIWTDWWYLPGPIGGPAPPAAPTLPAGKTYTVQPGDTIALIAGRFGVDRNVLATINHIPNANLIYPGQVLTIP
jgi:LysM domain